MTQLRLPAIILVGVVFLSMSVTASAGLVTEWNFENNPIATNNSPLASTGTGTASVIGMSSYATPGIGTTAADILAGANGDTGANGISDTSQIWRVRATGAGNGWSSAAPIASQGAVFATSTAGYSSIAISFGWYTTTQGEANLQLQYTTNGTTWTNLAVSNPNNDANLAILTNTTSSNTVMGSYLQATGGQDWFTGLTATINDPAAANDPNFAIRMVNASTGADDISASGTALNNTSGNWRFDRVSISATPLAVPEPASILMVAIAGGIAAAWRAKVRRMQSK